MRYIDTEPFWSGARDGKLVLQVDLDADRIQHYPRPVSLTTGSRRLDWRAVSGAGTIYARTLLGASVVALVELDEGVRLLAKILDAAPDAVRIGARVTLAWDRLEDGRAYPAFRLAA